MYSVDDIKRFVETVANKQQKGRITPDQLNIVFKAVNIQLMNERLGLMEEYQPGRPVPRQVYDQTIRSKMSMYPFQGKKQMYPNADTGEVSFPEDIIYPTSAFKKVSTGSGSTRIVTIDVVDEARASYRRGSALVGPTRDVPILVIEAGKFVVYPEDLGVFTLTYMRRPATPVWGFTESAGRYVYSAGTSTQFEWSDLDFTAISMRVLKLMGINFREGEIVAAASEYIQTGR